MAGDSSGGGGERLEFVVCVPRCHGRLRRDLISPSYWAIIGQILGGEHGNTLQYSCLENPMETGAWWATVHGVTKSQTGLSD